MLLFIVVPVVVVVCFVKSTFSVYLAPAERMAGEKGR